LASLLVGLAASVFVPMLPWVPKLVAVAGAAAIAGLPYLAYVILQTVAAQHGVRDDVAVIPAATGLICLNEGWAKALSEQLGSSYEPTSVRTHLVASWAFGGLVIAGLLTPWLYDSFHPVLRLVNLTESVLTISVDEHFLANVEPTQAENPRAGIFTNLAAGHHVLSARRADGLVVQRVTADVLAGQTHLFAPARPKGACFWVERSAVGRNSEGRSTREVLEGESGFWVLPTEIDVWFGPAQGSVTQFGTGGVVTSLRQGVCSDARDP